jgi:hypothetical protein
MRRANTLEELADLLRADFSQYDTDKRMEHAGIRLDSAIRKLTQAIRQRDRSAVILGYRLLMEDPHLPFGKILKSNLARALKRHIELLTEQEKLGLAGKTAALLSLPFCPREVEDYCRLVRKMGKPMADHVIALVRPMNEKARSLLAYLGMTELRASITHRILNY